jgi:hypothetical protein
MINGMYCGRGSKGMAISLEGLGGPTLPTGRQDRQHAQARVGRWLQELEQALLSQGAKKHAAPRGQQDGGRQVGDDAAVPARAARQPGSGVEASAPAALGQGVAAAAAGRTDGPPPGAGGERAAAPDAASRAAAPASDEAAASAAAVRRPAAMSATLAPVFAAAPGVGAMLPLLATGAYAKAGALAGMAAAGPRAGAADLLALPAARPPAAAVTALAAPGTAAEAPPPPSAAEQYEMAEPGRGAPRQPADGEDYASRLLHVYRDADGVQAWIRDASLDAAALPGLAEAMAGELGDAGARLATLTVNGRKQALPAPRRGGADAQDGYPVDTAQPAQLGGEPARPPINPNGAA